MSFDRTTVRAGFALGTRFRPILMIGAGAAIGLLGANLAPLAAMGQAARGPNSETAIAPPPPSTRPVMPATRPALSTTRPALPAPHPAPAAGTLTIAPPATRPATPPARAALPTTRPAAGGPVAAAGPATRPAVSKKEPEPLPTMDELQALFREQKFQDLSRQLARVLPLRGPAAAPYNKFDLNMLKLELGMRLKSSMNVLSALKEAQAATDDEKKLNWCRSIELLVRKSKNFQYQPEPTRKDKPKPIDIADPDSRLTALTALWTDELAAATPRVQKAVEGQSLPDIAAALKLIDGFDILESAVTGGQQTQQMVADLRTRGVTLITKESDRMDLRLKGIETSANELIRNVVLVPGLNGPTQEVRYRKRGLENSDWKDLKDIIATSEKLVPNLKGLMQATGGKLKDVEDLLANIEEIHRRADKTLNADYSV